MRYSVASFAVWWRRTFATRKKRKSTSVKKHRYTCILIHVHRKEMIDFSRMPLFSNNSIQKYAHRNNTSIRQYTQSQAHMLSNASCGVSASQMPSDAKITLYIYILCTNKHKHTCTKTDIHTSTHPYNKPDYATYNIKCFLRSERVPNAIRGQNHALFARRQNHLTALGHRTNKQRWLFHFDVTCGKNYKRENKNTT